MACPFPQGDGSVPNVAVVEDDAPLDEIGGKFRRAALERDADRLDDDLHRLGHGFAHFL